MSLDISSDKFTHPLLKPILLELTAYFQKAGISFFVIGATARDIVFEDNKLVCMRSDEVKKLWNYGVVF
tara:strand:- start:115 stop:321 length:207 start_codon:yes stop_codon:yes gene_type:complete